jgi:hypothetical protein
MLLEGVMRRLSAIVASLAMLAMVAAPAAAAQPTRELVPFGDFTEICFDTASEQWVTLNGSILVNVGAHTVFYDEQGNVTRELYSGGVVVSVTDPATGISVRINTSSAVTFDYVHGKFFFAGPSLFANTVALVGHMDWNTVTFHGAVKDYCPTFGYLSYDPNEVP